MLRQANRLSARRRKKSGGLSVESINSVVPMPRFHGGGTFRVRIPIHDWPLLASNPFRATSGFVQEPTSSRWFGELFPKLCSW
jgi:hypothetical protein